MNKHLHIVAGLLFLSIISMAQDVPAAMETKKKDCSCSFKSLFILGNLEGENGSSLQLQTIQGIQYGKWFAGIGAGLDYYHLRSIPVFADLRRELWSKKNTPFVYADAGYHFAWPRDREKGEYSTEINYEGGLYYDVGIGYRFGIGKQGGFLLSAGYSFKYLLEEHITPICINWVCQNEASEWYRRKLNRLSLKLGVQL